jgi:hypothetical protein
MTARRTLPEPAAIPETSAPQRPRDPVLAALPRDRSRTAVVFEANALTNSPVGELLLACIRHDAQEDPLEEFKRQSGIDVLKDLDRVAVSKNALLLSGHFAGADWDQIGEHMTASRHGDKATLYEPVRRDDGSPARKAFARWDNQLIILGDTTDDLRQAVDRIEGRAPEGPQAIDEQSTYGEVYGVLGTDILNEIVGQDQPELARRIQDAVSRVELHVTAMNDVGMVASVNGGDPAKVDDLARSLGAALSLARLKAQAQGDNTLAELLDLAKIAPNGTSFQVELALPMAFLEKHLAFCRAPRGSDAGLPR